MADPTWSNCVLLAHFDGTDGSQDFVDSSDSSHTISALGTAPYVELDTANKQFGTASLNADFATSYAGCAWDSDFDHGSSDFCWESGIYLNDGLPLGDTFLLGSSDSYPSLVLNNYFGLYAAIFKYKISGSANTIVFSFSGSPDIQSWKHFALDKNSTSLRFFWNGTQIDSTKTLSGTVDASSGTYFCFAKNADAQLDETRVSRQSLYTSNFTPPSSAFPEGAPQHNLLSATSTQKNESSTGVVWQIGTNKTAGADSTQANESAIAALKSHHLIAAQAAQKNQSVASIAGLTFSLPISIENYYRVATGIPIVIRVKSTPTLPTLPIIVGTYPVTATLPVVFRLRSTPTLPTLPVVIYGNQSATAGVGDFASWKPKCVINGVDMTAKLIGGGSVEFDEMAAPVASFSFLPTAGTVDPLAYVGQPVQIMLQFLEAGAVVAEYLVFTGLVSDPTWSVDDRVLTISATGDLQSQFDAMTKAQVSTQLASVSPTYSDVVFGDPDDLSGWEYAEALLSTVNAVVWQDSGGAIRVTSTLPKVSADFTYQDDGRFIGADIAYPSRLDLINKRTIEVAYRFSRLRQREVDVSFRPWQLVTPETWLSCEGGWDLPQRSQIESAASGSGWYPTTDIRYVDVWPNGLYTTRSCAGVNFMAGVAIEDAVRADLCVGANWTAARRWNQTVTETATITVGASESQAVVGVLADNESYAYESEYANEDWEDSLEDEDYSTSGMTQMASGDYKLDLDTDRSDFETAQEVAIAKARSDILKSHRGTTVTIQTTYQPQLDLSHTIEIDCAFVHCQGKVRRITHAWDIDTGDLTSEIAVALYRHNGAGLVSDTAVAATTKAADPDETAPETILQLPMYIGGRDDKPPYDETWTGYIVNMPIYESASTDPVDRAQVWARSPINPAVQTYPEGFHMVYPTIDSSYCDPGNAAATADFEVAVPEDLLELTA